MKRILQATILGICVLAFLRATTLADSLIPNGDFESSLTKGWRGETKAFKPHLGLCATGIDVECTQAAYVTNKLGNKHIYSFYDPAFAEDSSGRWQLDLVFAAAKPASGATAFFSIGQRPLGGTAGYGLLLEVASDGTLTGFKGVGSSGGGAWKPLRDADGKSVKIDWSVDANGNGSFADDADTLNVYSLRVVGDYTTRSPTYDVYLSEANGDMLNLIASGMNWFFSGSEEQKPSEGNSPVSLMVRNRGNYPFVIDKVSLSAAPVAPGQAKKLASIQRTIDTTKRVREFPALTVHRNTSIQKAPAPVLAELSEKELRRAKVTRCWLNMDEMWDYRTRKYTFNYKIGTPIYKDANGKYAKDKHPETWGGVSQTELRFDDHYLKPFSRHSDEVMLCIRRYERDILDGKLGVTMDDWQAMFKTAVKHSKQVCPNLRYIEVCNEYALRGFIGCTDDEYYPFYKRGYQAVNEVNKELNLTGKDRLLVGGPAVTGDIVRKIGRFLENYKNDPSPKKKLDFLTWHEYGKKCEDTAHREAQFNKMCEENELPTGLPMFVTEHDPHHGRTGDTHLNLWNGALLVKSLYFTDMYSPNVKLMPWVLYHNKKAQTRFMWFTGPNLPNTKAEELKMQPVACVMKFLAMHKKWELQVDENRVDSKDIVLASVGDDGLIVQAVNYSKPRDVKLKLEKLPDALMNLKQGKLRVKKYLVDSQHSNCITNPDYSGGIELIEETKVPVAADGSITLTHSTLRPYGTILWELLP